MHDATAPVSPSSSLRHGATTCSPFGAAGRALRRATGVTTLCLMARLSLTLDEVTDARLNRHARATKTSRSSAAEKLLAEALQQKDSSEREAALAAAYIADRKDLEAHALLLAVEQGQLELLGDKATARPDRAARRQRKASARRR